MKGGEQGGQTVRWTRRSKASSSFISSPWLSCSEYIRPAAANKRRRLVFRLPLHARSPMVLQPLLLSTTAGLTRRARPRHPEHDPSRRQPARAALGDYLPGLSQEPRPRQYRRPRREHRGQPSPLRRRHQPVPGRDGAGNPGRRSRPTLQSPGRGHRPDSHGSQRRRLHAHRQRQDADLQRSGPHLPAARPSRARPLRLSAQGPRVGPARRARTDHRPARRAAHARAPASITARRSAAHRPTS